MAKNIIKEEINKSLREKLNAIKHELPFKYPAMIAEALPGVSKHQVTKAFGERPVRNEILSKILGVALDIAFKNKMERNETEKKAKALLPRITED